MLEFEFIKEGFRYVPSIVGAIIIVLIFVAYLKEKDKHQINREAIFLKHIEARDIQFMETVRDVNRECHEVQQRSMNAMEKCIGVMGEVKNALSSFNQKN